VRKLTKALTVVSLLAPVSGHSLGIGDIRVRSALNQNLNAEIALVASRGENPANIKVSLAPAEKFDEAGVPWTYFLSKIRFTPLVRPNGSMVIKVTSREALKEPYLNFLLEVSWPKGNLYREFTVLVDPPAEYQQQTYQEPQYQEPTYPTSSSYDTYRPPKQDYVPRQRVIRHRVAKPRRSQDGSYGGQILTRRNDSLWNVAERARDAGVSVEQMMVALYEKNPQAFYQQNVNALSAGKRLQVPDKAIVQQTSRQEALAEFSQHNEAWNNNRASVPTREPQSANEDPVDTQLKLEAPAEATVAANETVSPSSEQTSGTRGVAAMPSESTNPDVKQLAAQNKDSAPVNEAMQSKIAALEKQMAMMQELIALKDKQLADLQNPSQATAPATQTPPAQVIQQVPPVSTPTQPSQVVQPQVSPEQPIQAVPSQEKPVQPTVSPKPIANPNPVIKKVEQPPAIADEPPSPLLWVLGALGVVLVPLLGWIWWQKKKVVQEAEAESMFRNYSSMQKNDTTGPFSAIRKTAASSELASGESSFLNDFKASDFESFESFNVDHGDIDPLAEADVYLAYGRYQQAEDLIRQAIKDYPDRDDCKLKLLEIYHASSSKEDFENYAVELIAARKNEDKAFWPKVVLLSQDICPASEIFSYTFEDSTAVFSADPEALTENILLSPSEEQIATPKPTQEPEQLGAANFDVSDVDEGESFFDAAPSQEPPVQDKEEIIVSTAKPEIKSDESGLVLGSNDEENFAGQQNNESLDFDLGSYSGVTKKDEPEINVPVFEELSYEIDAQLSKPDNLDDKNELESYDFKLNFDNIAGQKPAEKKVILDETGKADDAWDPDQTLEFSFDSDESSEKDIFGKDILDFSFDLDSASTDFGKPTDANQGFRVSDLTDMDEMETKLDLAKAYIDMGDVVAAKEIIGQVVENGSAEQKTIAKLLLDDLS
jgi:pilus assembly protein FimV